MPGNPLKCAAIARLQRASYAELRARRAEAVASVRAVAELELVNAGGTGDLHLIADEDAVTEGNGRLGLLRAGVVRHLQLVLARARGDVRAAGLPPSRARTW